MCRTRTRAVRGLLLVFAAVGPAVASADGDNPSKPSEPKWLVDASLAVSPAPIPVPAFKYRLFPTAAERKEGNAVPIYLRLSHEQSDASRQRWREQPEKWNKLPIDKIPVAEAKKFLNEYRYMLRQFELGARRKTAEWNYTLDAGSIIDLRLPDAQQMRSFMPLLILKARVEVAQKDYAAAVRTLETGFSFSQQIAEGPFIINGLIGAAGSSLFSDVVADAIGCPDAPNLYWAIAAMPQPLIDLRRAFELESNILEAQFPDLADLDRPRTAEQWDAVLARVRRDIERIRGSYRDAKPPAPVPGTTSGDPAAKSPDLARAKKYLTEQAGLTAATVEAMPPAQVLVVWFGRRGREVADELLRSTYVPYPQSVAVNAAAARKFEGADHDEATRLGRELLPAPGKVYGAQVRIERKLALLRVVEALRYFAAANAGKWPDRLDQIKDLPVPADPGTGKPFDYVRDGDAVVVSGFIPGDPGLTGLRYRLTLRK